MLRQHGDLLLLRLEVVARLLQHLLRARQLLPARGEPRHPPGHPRRRRLGRRCIIIILPWGEDGSLLGLVQAGAELADLLLEREHGAVAVHLVLAHLRLLGRHRAHALLRRLHGRLEEPLELVPLGAEPADLRLEFLLAVSPAALCRGKRALQLLHAPPQLLRLGARLTRLVVGVLQLHGLVDEGLLEGLLAPHELLLPRHQRGELLLQSLGARGLAALARLG
mmetsp:Transcript_43147/g.137799  ORF Transcript_43147/g.137799 Transcript_43147/m.137799 type:complete len:223 (-) Transcript_43147:196-864(-)